MYNIQFVSVRIVSCIILIGSNRILAEKFKTSNSESSSVEPSQREHLTTLPIDDYQDINSNSRKSEILDQLLDHTYDSKIRPQGTNGFGPVKIDVNLLLRSIETVDDVRMEYTVQLIFRQHWIDPRLKYFHLEPNVEYLQLVVPSRIWMPDMYFINEKKGILHELITPNIFTRIYPNGAVLQSYRITLLLACPMNLRTYPLDKQSCPIQISSYGYTTQDIDVHWKEVDPVQYQIFMLSRFKIESYTPISCTSVTVSGNFSCIELDILLARNFGFYFIQIYIPCTMLVIISWVSFWLEPTAVEARVSLGVTTILTIVTQTYGINQSVPPASYVKALDIWTALCQILVFGVLLQFALVNYTARLTSGEQINGFELFHRVGENGEDGDDAKDIKMEYLTKQKCLFRAKRIDKISRIAFPTVFLMFNITYWTSYGIIL